jgi:hypothetical protein
MLEPGGSPHVVVARWVMTAIRVTLEPRAVNGPTETARGSSARYVRLEWHVLQLELLPYVQVFRQARDKLREPLVHLLPYFKLRIDQWLGFSRERLFLPEQRAPGGIYIDEPLPAAKLIQEPERTLLVFSPAQRVLLDLTRGRATVLKRGGRAPTTTIARKEAFAQGEPERGFQLDTLQVGLKLLDVVRDSIASLVNPLQDGPGIRKGLLEFG